MQGLQLARRQISQSNLKGICEQHGHGAITFKTSSAVGAAFVDAAVVVIYTRKEPAPLGPGTPIGHQRHGAILTGPVMVRHHAAQTNAIALHQYSRQLSGTIPSAEVIVPTALALAHLNTDGMVITGIGAGMPARFIKGQVLHHHELVNSKMPTAVGKGTLAQCAGVLHGRGRCRVVCRTMNRNEGGSHAARTAALLGAPRHHAYLNVRLLSQTTDGTRNNLPPDRLKLKDRRRSQVGISPLLLAAQKTSQNEDKKCHQFTIRHAPILPRPTPDSKPNLRGRQKKTQRERQEMEQTIRVGTIR